MLANFAIICLRLLKTHQPGTCPAVKSVEKRMFSQAKNSCRVIACRVVKTVTFLSTRESIGLDLIFPNKIAFIFSASIERKCFIFGIRVQVMSSFQISDYKRD